jgi:hypothetical protein
MGIPSSSSSLMPSRKGTSGFNSPPKSLSDLCVREKVDRHLEKRIQRSNG